MLLLLLMLLLLRLLQQHQSLLLTKLLLHFSQPTLHNVQLTLQLLIPLHHHRLPRRRLLLLQLRNRKLVPQPRRSIGLTITSQPLFAQSKRQPRDLRSEVVDLKLQSERQLIGGGCRNTWRVSMSSASTSRMDCRSASCCCETARRSFKRLHSAA
jgi:hypothetical protein